ncbi:MAG: NAD(P)H-dependent oxidoreductase [Bacteroidetes bacterium]|nr:NAD(P)H-dependent oxidoreductase [Bacteroidota bacterium]
MGTKKIRLLGISGSLRKASCNTGLLRAASEVLPSNMNLEIYSLANITLYNGDLESNPSNSVVEFKKKIAESDALLIAIPEYNYSISGVLKNAIDWASRPAKDSPLNGKPFAMMGAGGGLGTARAQYHFRQIAVYTNMFTFNKPEVFVPNAWEKFDSNGNLKDESIKERIKILLETLELWVKKFQVNAE